MTDLQRWNLFVYYANEAARKYLSQSKARYWRWFTPFGVFAIKAESAWAFVVRNPR